MTGPDPQPAPAPEPGPAAPTIDLYQAAAEPARQESAYRLARDSADDGEHIPIDAAVYALRAALQLYGGADLRTAQAAAALASLLRGVVTRPQGRPRGPGLVGLPTGRPSPDELAASRLTIADQLHRNGRCEQAAREATAAVAQRAAHEPRPSLAVAVVLTRVLALLAMCRRGDDANHLLTEYTSRLPPPGGPLHRLTVDIAVPLLKTGGARRPVHSIETCKARHTGGKPRSAADIRAELLHRLEQRPPVQPPAPASSPERAALHEAIIARHADGTLTFDQIAAEAGYSYGTVHRVLSALDRPLRRRRLSRPAAWSPLRIGVAAHAAQHPALPDLSRDYDTSLCAALTALGHTPDAVDPVDPGHAEGSGHGLDAVILLWHPGAAIEGLTELLHHHTAAAPVVLVCDLGRQLPAGHPLRQHPGVRIVDGRGTAREAPIWPYPVPDSLWDRTGPAELSLRDRPIPALTPPGIDTEVGDRLESAGFTVRTGPAGVDAYADALTTVLPAPGRHHTIGQLVQLIAAVGHGCLPLVPVDTPAARLTPALLHIRGADDAAATVRRLLSQAGRRAHHELIGACRLRLATHRLSGYVPDLLEHLRSTPAAGAGTGPGRRLRPSSCDPALTAADGGRR